MICHFFSAINHYFFSYCEKEMQRDIASIFIQKYVSFPPLHFLWNLFHDALYRAGRSSIQGLLCVILSHPSKKCYISLVTAFWETFSRLSTRLMTGRRYHCGAPTFVFKSMHASFVISLTEKKFEANLHQQPFFAEYVQKKQTLILPPS